MGKHSCACSKARCGLVAAATLGLTVLALLAVLQNSAVAQTVETQQLLELHQYSRARSAFQEEIKDVPWDELERFAYKDPWHRYSFLAEVCAERTVQLEKSSAKSLVGLAFRKLWNGKIEAAELVLADARNSDNPELQAALKAELQKRIEKLPTQTWSSPELEHLIRGALQLLSGDYDQARLSLQVYDAASGGRYGNSYFPAWLIWCSAKSDPAADIDSKHKDRTSLLTVATILAQRGNADDAITQVRDAIRSSERGSSKRPLPFFLEDFPTCERLLQGQTPTAIATRRDYEILLKLHKVAAAMVAFQKENGHFPRADLNGVSWRKQIVPYFQLPEETDVVQEMYAVNPGDLVTPFVVVKGPNTAFSPDEQIAPGRQIPDGTSNTMMICVAPQPVPWDSTEDMTADEFLTWRSSTQDGTFAAACDGQIDWYDADFSEGDWNKFVNRRDWKSRDRLR